VWIGELETYAYRSKLKNVAPLPKLLFALLTLGVCLWAGALPISLLVLLLMGGVTVRQGGIPVGFWGKLFLIPGVFLTLGIAAVVVRVTKQPPHLTPAFPIAGFWVGITAASWRQGLRLFGQGLAAFACLAYLTLNTPVVDLLVALRKLKAPTLLLELMALTYRLIFVFGETANTIFTAQNARLGYIDRPAAYRSLSVLVSSLLARAWRRADQLYTALEARGYDGELPSWDDTAPAGWREYVAPLAFNAVLIGLALIMPPAWKGHF
jgi:cobalt/nickel transport system permease protein